MNAGDDLESRARARVGRVLGGKWRLDALIGVGGMASVYAATHRVGRRAAVKMLHPEISLDTSARQRFLREGYVANKVGHPGAVSVLDDDTAEDGAAFLVMDLLEGETVEARARRLGRLSVAEAVWIADQVLDVLHAAHKNGIVHRDIKPDNLFLTRDGALKVLDFGIARVRDESGAMKATRTGSMLGTPAFMPPEQALGKKDAVDARSDLWAVGATMFDILTGRTVHVGETINQLLLAAMTKPAQPIREVAPHIPPQVAAVIDRSLAFESAGRFPDARAMQQALRAGVAGAQPVPKPIDALPEPVSHEEAYAPTVSSSRDAASGTLALPGAALPPLAAAATLESASNPALRAPAVVTVPVVSIPQIGGSTESAVSSDRVAPPSPRRGSRALVIGAVATSAVVAAVALALRFAGGSGGGADVAPGVTAPVEPAASASPAASAGAADTVRPEVTPAPPPPVTAEPSAAPTAAPSATAAAKPLPAHPPRTPPRPPPGPRPPSKKGILDKW